MGGRADRPRSSRHFFAPLFFSTLWSKTLQKIDHQWGAPHHRNSKSVLPSLARFDLGMNVAVVVAEVIRKIVPHLPSSPREPKISDPIHSSLRHAHWLAMNVSATELAALEASLLNKSGNIPLHNRFRALFTLKALKSADVIRIISEGLLSTNVRVNHWLTELSRVPGWIGVAQTRTCLLSWPDERHVCAAHSRDGLGK